MKYFFYIIFLGILMGCGEKTPRKLYFRDLIGLSPDLTDAISSEVQDLNSSSGREIISFSPGNKPISVRMVERTGVSTSETLAHARYLEYHCLIEIRSDINDVIKNQINPFNPATVTNEELRKGLEFIVMHELGHCFGLKHSTDINNIMYPEYQTTWGQVQINEFSKILSNISE